MNCERRESESVRYYRDNIQYAKSRELGASEPLTDGRVMMGGGCVAAAVGSPFAQLVLPSIVCAGCVVCLKGSANRWRLFGDRCDGPGDDDLLPLAL